MRIFRAREMKLIAKQAIRQGVFEVFTGILKYSLEYSGRVIIKIVSVDMATATMRLQVWRRVKWTDPRMAWDPAEWGGVWEIRGEEGIHTGGANSAPDNNIWTPHLFHYNAAADPEVTLEKGACSTTPCYVRAPFYNRHLTVN